MWLVVTLLAQVYTTLPKKKEGLGWIFLVCLYPVLTQIVDYFTL